MQSAIMPILWIVQQQLDKAHHITPTTVVKGAVQFPAQGSGGWVRPTLLRTLTLAVTLMLAMDLTLTLTPTLGLTLTLNPSPSFGPNPDPRVAATLTPGAHPNQVPLAAMHKIADRLGCSHMDVYEVSTFFTMYNRKPQGKFHIQLCGTTPCMVCGAYDILCAPTRTPPTTPLVQPPLSPPPSPLPPSPLPPSAPRPHPLRSPSPTHLGRDTIEAHLGIKAGGETSGDGLFTLTEVECLGACVNAPMVQINDWFFEDLTPATTVKLLDDLKAGRPVKIGPQNERIHSEGPMGRTSLIGEASGPQCRDLSALGAAAAPK